MQNPRARRVIAALLAVLATTGITIAATDDGDHHRTITVDVSHPSPATSPATAPMGDLQTKDITALRDETPPSVPRAVLEHADQVEQHAAAHLPPADDPLPVAGAQGFACRTDLASRGFGDRQPGAKVMSVKLHFTVGPNIPGWGDVDGTGDFLERIGLSAHDIMDFEGHCEHKVPYAKKAFTQGAFNSTSDSIEIIALGTETRAQWLAAPIFKQGILAAWLRDRLTARGLPSRFVDPAGCTDQLGYTDHNHLECANNHTDVAPSCAAGNPSHGQPLYPAFAPVGCSGFPFDVLAQQLAASASLGVSKADRVLCRKLNWWRRAGRPHGRPELRAVKRKHTLIAHHVTCLLGQRPARS